MKEESREQVKKRKKKTTAKSRAPLWLHRMLKERAFVRRNVKDRLFCYIFEKDRSALLELYNALNGTDYVDPDALKIVTVENVIYLSMKNDLAFTISGVLNLYEQQSTVCPNIPVRFLIYLGEEYQKIIGEYGDEKLYGTKLLKLPTPRCVVFYNGNKEEPEESFLYLSEAYEQQEADPAVELRVRMLNINYGYNQRLMDKCHRLWEYSYFVELVNAGLREGKGIQVSGEEAVEECLRRGILEDILSESRKEVLGMLLHECNEKKVWKYLRQEAREIGLEEGLAEGREEGRKEGREEGREEGRKEGREEGLAEGHAKGRMEGFREAALKLARHGNAVETIAEILEIDIDLAKQWLTDK